MSAYLSKDEQDESLEGKNAITDWSSFKILLKYVRPYVYPVTFALILIFLSAMFTLLSAKYMGTLVEDGLMPKNFELSKTLALYVVGFELIAITILYFGRRVIAHYASKTIYDIRESLFDHLQKLPMSFYDRQPQGRVITRITHDIEGIESFFTTSLSRLVNAIVMATMAMLAMLLTEWRIGSILIFLVFPGIIFLFSTRHIVRKVMRKMSKGSSAINSKLSEFLNGIDVIRTYGLEKWSRKEFQKTIDRHHDAQMKANTFFAWTRPMTSTLCVLPLIGLVWFGGQRVLAGTMSVGLFVTFLRYCESFFGPIRTLSQELHVIQQAFTSIERVSVFFSHAEEDSIFGNDDQKINHQKLAGEITFDKVSMTYSTEAEVDKWILKELSFNIASGEKIGLVGRTGCGKTTTVSLISRLYPYQKGQILMDKTPIEDYSRSFLRKNIGFVSQEVILFKGTLQENLMVGYQFSKKELEEACQLTGLAEIMLKNNLSFDTMIIENGSNLSVGERQLVSLTRVLLNDPKILILDEATANIDPFMEKIIHGAVDKIMQGRTCLIIAHRLDTLKSCDRLMVFEDGQLVEEGKHDVLLGKQGKFYDLQHASEEQFIQ